MFENGKPVEGQVQIVASDSQEPPKDPMVSAEPPKEAEAQPVTPEAKSSEEKPEAKEEKKPTSVKAKRTNMAQPPKKKTSQRKRSIEDQIVSRARREFRKKMKPVAEALGIDPNDDEAFNAKIDEMLKVQEESKSVSERLEGRSKALEEKNGELNAKIHQLQTELTKSRRELVSEQRSFQNLQIEYEIRTEATKAGLRDHDYAVHLFKQFVKSSPEDAEIDPGSYFEGLKKDSSNRHLFVEESVSAGPKPVSDQVQNQEAVGNNQNQAQNLPPQGAPKPVDPGTNTQEAPDALTMNQRDFNKHTQDKYGFRAGLA